MENQALINKVNELSANFEGYVKAGLIKNQSQLAKSIGVSPAQISSFFRGKYSGDNETLIKKIESHYKLVEGRKNLNTGGVPFVFTSNAKRVYNACGAVHKAGYFGVVVGRAGLGKTYALHNYSDEFRDVVYLEIDQTTNQIEFLKDLCNELKIDDKGLANTLKKRIVEKIKGSGRLIIIDQAEYLPIKAMDVLRSIHDQTKVGVLLVGLPLLWKKINTGDGLNDQITTRVFIKTELNELKETDVEMMVNAFIQGDEELYKKYMPYCQGNARRLTMLMEHTKRIDGKNVKDETIIGAYKMTI